MFTGHVIHVTGINTTENPTEAAFAMQAASKAGMRVSCSWVLPQRLQVQPTKGPMACNHWVAIQYMRQQEAAMSVHALLSNHITPGGL